MRPSYHIVRNWTLEVLAIILAIGLIAAIGSILTIYNGKPVPDLGVNLTLNALLALLSTVLRGLLVVIVAQIISQRKWDWYTATGARPLEDLQKFDAGSRGILGAFQLIPTVALHDGVTLVAALILLLSFLVGPFVQQTSSTAECYFASLNASAASIPTAHWVPRSGGYRTSPGTMGETGWAAPDLIVAILSSVTSPDGVENRIIPNCATGNCTFDDLPPGKTRQEAQDSQASMHSAAAVCSACTDVTSLVTRDFNASTMETNHFLPNGMNLTFYTPAVVKSEKDLSWVEGLQTKDARAASRWAYVNATFFSKSRDSKTGVASVCSLYPCLRTYTTLVVENQLQEQEVQSELMQLEYSDANPYGTITFDGNKWTNAESNMYFNYTAVRSSCRINGRTLNSTSASSIDASFTNLTLYDYTSSPPIVSNFSLPEQCIYRQDPEFVSAIAQTLGKEIFDGSCSSYRVFTCTKTTQPFTTYNGQLLDVGAGAVLRTLYNDVGNNSFSNITLYFDKVATSLSNKLRVNYGTPFKPITLSGAEPPAPDMVRGTAWQTKTCVKMRWIWLLLPICLTALTTLLSAWTIWTNWRHRHVRPIWQDSILPFLFYGNIFVQQEQEILDGGIVRQVGGKEEERKKLMEASEMNKAARDVSIKIMWPEEGGSALLHRQAHKSVVSTQQPDRPLTSRQEGGLDDVSLH